MARYGSLESDRIRQPEERREGSGALHTVKSGILLSLNTSTLPIEEENKVLKNQAARVLLAGAGFLSDAYDLFVINMVIRLLRDGHPQFAAEGTISGYEAMIASAALVGAVVGQLCAGHLADIMGRKAIFVITAVLIIFGNLGAASSTNTDEAFTIYHKIAFFRFFTGVGIGGEYPLAATVTSESSSAENRGHLMASVFAMQGLGALLSVCMVIACLSLGLSTNFTWRLALGFGALPSIIAFPWRLCMHETESFKLLQRDRTLTRGTHRSRWSELWHAFHAYKWHVLGTALSWAFIDVSLYANGLFSHDVTANVLQAKGNEKFTVLDDACYTCVTCLIAVPGYYCAVMYIDKVGRKAMQVYGFIAVSIVYFISGYGHDWFVGRDVGGDVTNAMEVSSTGSQVRDGVPMNVRRILFLAVYGLTFFFSNFGPNTTTFVIPGEIYPSEVRATCHGFSAAMGKVGAAVGAYLFPIVMVQHGLPACMYICAAASAFGAITTYVLTPTYGAPHLRGERVYVTLDHECLRPKMTEYHDDGTGDDDDFMALSQQGSDMIHFQRLQQDDGECTK